MEILSYRSEMAPELAGLYNQMVRGWPHCHPVDPERFASVLASGAAGHHAELLHEQEVLVASDRGSLQGFVHTAIESPEKEGGRETGILRFMCYRPGARAAGENLLRAAEERMAKATCSITAFHHHYLYPFYHMSPPAYLSDRAGHILGLLGRHGYRRSAGEVFLNWEDFGLPEPAAPEVSFDLVVERKDGKGRRQNVTVMARQGGSELGICACESCGVPGVPDEMQDWFMTYWLGVEEAYQGHGLGRWLLARALREARDIGYRHAAISTAWDNFRALLFYSNFGYRVVDWTYAFEHEVLVGR